MGVVEKAAAGGSGSDAGRDDASMRTGRVDGLVDTGRLRRHREKTLRSDWRREVPSVTVARRSRHEGGHFRFQWYCLCLSVCWSGRLLVSVYLSLCVCLSVSCLLVCLSACLLVCILSACLSLPLLVCLLSACLSLSTCLPVCLFVSVCLSIYLSACLHICLSVSPPPTPVPTATRAMGCK